MKLKIYTLFDAAAEAFITPFYMQNDGLAIRAFQDNVNSEQRDNVTQHPEQFTLFLIGEYDDKTGNIENYDIKKPLAIGVELINDNKPRYTNVDMETIMDEVANINKKIDDISEHQVTLKDMEDNLPPLLTQKY